LVVPVVAERVPAVVENVTVVPDMAVPPESVTTAVIVTPDDPSPGTVAAVEVTFTEAGVPVLVPVPQVEVVVPVLPLKLPQPLSPPHPARARSVNPKRTIIEANLRIFLTLKLGCRRGSCRINTR